MQKPAYLAYGGRRRLEQLEQRGLSKKRFVLYFHMVCQQPEAKELVVKVVFAVFRCIQMQSKRRTPVSVLRGLLGLTVAEFAELIGKSLVTVNSLETGRLKLSEETAQTISEECGVSMGWLLAGKPKEKPYFTDVENGVQPYTRECFERVQAAKQKPNPHPLDPALNLTVSDIASVPWHLVYAHAEKAGNGQLALYLYRQFLDGLVGRFGTDPEVFLRVNKDARRVYANGAEWAFASAKALELKELGDVTLTRVGGPVSVRKRATPKTLPVQDVPVDADGYPDWGALTAETEENSSKVDSTTTTAAPSPTRKHPSRRSK